MPTPPCTKDCPKRSPTCHAHCQQYLDYKVEQAAANKQLSKERERIEATLTYMCKQVPKRKR